MSLIPLTILVPLLAAGVLAAARPVCSRAFADAVALLAAVSVLVLCAILMQRSAHRELVYWFGGWRPHHGVALGISFAFGALGAGFATFCAALMVAALIFSWRFMEVVDHLFHVVLLVFLAGMVGFCLSGDLFNMFVFFELMGAAAFVLAGFMIEKRAPLEGSFNFAVTNSIGAILVLLGISLLYGRTGALNLAQIGAALDHAHADGLVVVAFALIVCGFLVKAAIVPFHFWLADAYAVAPTPVCILFAGAMSELGLLGIARVYWTSFHGVLGAHDAALRAVLVTVGLITGVLGGVLALAQQHLKRLLAFATISYVGLFTLGVAMLTPAGLAGSAAYVVGDGFVKASLFVAVGIAQYRLAGVEEARLQGHGQRLWFPAAVFALGGLAVAGCPPFGPFLGHSLVEDAAVQAGYGWIPAAMLLISALTGAAVLRTGARVFLELGAPPKRDESGRSADEESEVETEAPHAKMPALLALPAAALLAAGLAWGLIPGLTHSLIDAASRFTDHSGYIRTVLSGIPSNRAAPAGGGPSADSYLYGSGATIAAVAFAALALYVERLPRPLGSALARLRALHSGRIGDYVAWLSVGVATIGGAFALTLR
ncbi:MAG: complex I subunit 5 family protein [Solirubrobacteraceae bacterium]